MANEKLINTRIQLKYDSLENWSSKNPTLKSGELAIAYLPPKGNGNAPAATSEAVLFKVGPGAFNSLPWASALAADVYSWAKKTGIEIIDDGSTGSVISNIEWKNDKLVVSRIDAYTKSEVNALIKSVEDKVDGLDESITTVAQGTAITVTDAGTGNDHAYTVALDVEGAKIALGLKSAAYVTVESLNETAKGYADDVEAKLPTSADYGVLEVKGDSNSGVVVDDTDKQKPIVKIAANTYDAYGAAAQALAEAKEYANGLPHENTAHSHSVGAGLKLTGNGGISGDVEYALNVAFELVDKTIKLYDKNDSNKTALATLDATEFIADGMLKSVTADQTNNKLVFEWNTDAGVTTTEIALDSIADIYTGSNGSEVNVSVSNQNVISASLNSDIAAKIAKAHDHSNKAELDKIAEGDKAKWDDAYDKRHEHSNKALLDTYTQTEANLADAVTKKHSHSNKALLDTYDQTNDNIKAAVEATHNHANKAELDLFATGDKAKLDSALQTITTTANGGLKVTNKNQIDIDTSVVFVFNCGSATELVD